MSHLIRYFVEHKMSDQRKTKAQLLDELQAMRQQLSGLETLAIDHKQAEDELKRQLAVERDQRLLAEKLHEVGTLLSSSLNYETVLDCILEQMGHLIPHDAACVMLVVEDTVRTFRWHGYARLGSEYTFALRTFKLADIPALRLMGETSRPFLVSYSDDHDPWIHGHGKQWVKSHLGAPICIRGQTTGFLILDSATPGYFNQNHVDLLQRLANLAAAALANAQIYDQARQEVAQRVRLAKKEQNFVSAILNTASALVMVLSPEGRILRLNRAYEETTGYSLDEVRGRYFWDIFLPLDEFARIKTIFTTSQAEQFAGEFECYWLTQERKRRLIFWSNSLMSDHRGSVEFVICTGIDITEQRQLEERLVAIHQLGRELNLLRDEVEICKIALETASFLLQIKSSGYGVIDQTTGELKYTYFPIRGVPNVLALRLPFETESRIKQLIVQRETISAADGYTTIKLSHSAELATHSWLTAPMQIRERTIGVLDVENLGLSNGCGYLKRPAALLNTAASV
jgi:PAS domain S-box-containing protein